MVASECARSPGCQAVGKTTLGIGTSVAVARAALLHGPISDHCFHLCIDMQVIFAADTQWHTPWMARVRPVVQSLAAHRLDRTIFTRFMSPKRPEDMRGTWRRYKLVVIQRRSRSEAQKLPQWLPQSQLQRRRSSRCPYNRRERKPSIRTRRPSPVAYHPREGSVQQHRQDHGSQGM